MQDQNDLTEEQREIEQELQSLAARPGRMDPVAAAFAAGRRSTAKNLNAWRGAACGLLLIAIASWMVPTAHNTGGPQKFEPSTVVIHSQPPSAPPMSDQSLLILQQTATQRGVDALPQSPLSSFKPIVNNESI
jgi:hypothetical protein